MNKYLKVAYKVDGAFDGQLLKLSEVYLVNKVLLEVADAATCTVTIITCTEKEYKLIFE